MDEYSPSHKMQEERWKKMVGLIMKLYFFLGVARNLGLEEADALWAIEHHKEPDFDPEIVSRDFHDIVGKIDGVLDQVRDFMKGEGATLSLEDVLSITDSEFNIKKIVERYEALSKDHKNYRSLPIV